MSKLNTPPCQSYAIQKFTYTTKRSKGKYFAIWGCYQLNKTSYDRGLWIFGANENKSDFNVVNAEGIVDEALKDLGLDQDVNVKKNMMINRNIFGIKKEICKTDPYYFDCERLTPANDMISKEHQKRTSSLIVKNRETDADRKVILFVVLCIILMIIALSTCIHCIIKLV